MKPGREVIILSPIGNPRSWRKVVYKLGSGCSVESEWSAVALLAEAVGGVSGREGGVRLLAVASDSLVQDEGLCSWGDIKDRVERDLRERLVEIIRESSLLGCSIDQEGLKRYVDTLSLAVCPGVGVFRIGQTEYSFRGSLQLYHLCFLINSLASIVGVEPEPGEAKAIEVWLDLSHGVNYMPSAALAATFKLSEILNSLGLEHTVKFFNSDPVLSFTKEVGINELSLRVEPSPAAALRHLGSNMRDKIEELFERPDKLFSRDIRYKTRGGSPSFRREPMDAPTPHRKIIRELWTSVAYGYPLLLLSRAPSYKGEVLDFRNFTTKLLDMFYDALRQVECRVDCWKKVVPTAEAISYDYSALYPTFLELYATFDYILRSLIKTIGGRDVQDGFSLRELSDIAASLLSRVSFPHIRHFVGRDIKDIVCTVLKCVESDVDVSDWRPMSSLRSECRIEGLKCEEDSKYESFLDLVRVRYKSLNDVTGRLNERNFIAHLGLLYDLLEVKREVPRRN